jgi:uncharacterized cupredoxin-like copper-binding protein
MDMPASRGGTGSTAVLEPPGPAAPAPPSPALRPGHPGILAIGAIAVIVAACVAASALFIGTSRSRMPGALAPPAPAPSRTVTISLTEFKLSMSELVLPAGKVTLKITNNGAIAHELVVFRLSGPTAQIPMAGGNMNEDGPGVTDVSDGDNLNPGQSVTRPADFTPGTYLFVCNLPGHYMAGMHQSVIVK